MVHHSLNQTGYAAQQNQYKHDATIEVHELGYERAAGIPMPRPLVCVACGETFPTDPAAGPEGPLAVGVAACTLEVR